MPIEKQIPKFKFSFEVGSRQQVSRACQRYGRHRVKIVRGRRKRFASTRGRATTHASKEKVCLAFTTKISLLRAGKRKEKIRNRADSTTDRAHPKHKYLGLYVAQRLNVMISTIMECAVKWEICPGLNFNAAHTDFNGTDSTYIVRVSRTTLYRYPGT
jgi:hypothetical protein